jgi:hypothetical protein
MSAAHLIEQGLRSVAFGLAAVALAGFDAALALLRDRVQDDDATVRVLSRPSRPSGDTRVG